jgi:hypothetical protein
MFTQNSVQPIPATVAQDIIGGNIIDITGGILMICIKQV